MTAARRARLTLALLAGVLLTTLVVVPADARLPRARPYRAGHHLTLDTNLLSASGASAWAIDAYLAAHTSLPRLGAAFMAAERKYGINARFLLAAALHESGWGRGYIARSKHNLFGYNAYDRNPVRFANAYRSYAANIDDTARFIKDFYLTPGGRWWGGRPTLRSMQQFWSSSGQWGVQVSRIASSLHLDTLRARRISFDAPDVGGPVHAGASALVGLGWSGGALPSTMQFAATWEPVEIDPEAAPGATDGPIAALPQTGEATLGSTTVVEPGYVPSLGNPAPSGEVAARARRVRSAGRTLTLDVTTPPAPGRYVLHLELRDADGGRLPAADQVPIPGVEVRAWAARAVSYAIEPGDDGTGAVITITNTGRTTIPAAAGDPVSVSNNPEVEVPRTTITVTSAAGDPATGAPAPLAMTPLRSDLPPRGSTTVVLPNADVAAVVVSVTVLGDAAWLGATSTGVLVLEPSGTVAPQAPVQRPGPPAPPSPAPTPSPQAPAPPPPAPTPSTAPVPRAGPHVTTTVTERNAAIAYRGRWADASSGGYVGGHVAWSSTPGSTAAFTFTGTSVAWIGPVGPTRGRALVLLDGRPVARVTLWRSSFHPRAVLFRRSFATSGRHRLTIQVLPAPGRRIVAIDAFQVRS